MDEEKKDIVVPVIREELYADAVPVATGGVRVTKRVESHEEIVEQELKKSHIEVKRVKTNRVVDGPQPSRRAGNTLIIPVVSEVLRIEKQWVVTEEIHITETQETETVQNKVTLNAEQARVERIDSEGNVVRSVDEAVETPPAPASAAVSLLQRRAAAAAVSKRKTLGRTQSLLKKPSS